MSSAAEQEAVQDPEREAVQDPGAVAAVRAEIVEVQRTEYAEAVRAAAPAPASWPGAPMPLGARFRVGPD
ncbi:hypothetical protein LCE32_36035, partial [Streptomyces sp. 7G]|uniref:hypothetical protein n=1 Tax=Streptomyces sp. 7G TaxID=2877241 RepID=UPI001CD5EB24